MSDLHTAYHLLNVGRPEAALAQLADLSGDDLDVAAALELRAYAQLGVGALHAAAADARRAQELDPDEPGAAYVLSLAEAELGQLAEAERAILRALELAPDEPAALIQYARILMRGHVLDKADRVLQAAASAGAARDDLLRARVDLAYLRGDNAEAEGLTRLLLAEDAVEPHGHQMLGVLAAQDNRFAEAEQRFGEAVRLDPTRDHLADAAREARITQGAYYWPLRLFNRFGAPQMWVAAIATLVVLRAMGLTILAGIVGLTWMLLCVWSWAAHSRLEHRLR